MLIAKVQAPELGDAGVVPDHQREDEELDQPRPAAADDP